MSEFQMVFEAAVRAVCEVCEGKKLRFSDSVCGVSEATFQVGSVNQEQMIRIATFGEGRSWIEDNTVWFRRTY